MWERRDSGESACLRVTGETGCFSLLLTARVAGAPAIVQHGCAWGARWTGQLLPFAPGDDNGVRFHIRGYNRAGSHHSSFANGHTRQNYAVRANRGAFLNDNPGPQNRSIHAVFVVIVPLRGN